MKNMDAQAEIEFTQSTFDGIIRREQRRLSTGLAMRQYIYEQLELGVTPDHYRMKWIATSVLRVIGCLEEIAKDFNQVHPDDKVSAADFLDILHSASRTLASRAGVGD